MLGHPDLDGLRRGIYDELMLVAVSSSSVGSRGRARDRGSRTDLLAGLQPPRLPRVEQLLRPSHGSGAGGDPPERRATGTRHESRADWRCTTTRPTSSRSFASIRRAGGREPVRERARSAQHDPRHPSRPPPILYPASLTTAAVSNPTTNPMSPPTTSLSSANSHGEVCINFTYSSIMPALHALGRELTTEEQDAIDVLRRVLVRQQVEVRLERGEAAMANNFAMCHSRSDFVDGTTRSAAATYGHGWRCPSRTAASRSAGSSSTWRTRIFGSDSTSSGPRGLRRSQRLRQRRRRARQPLQGDAGQADRRLMLPPPRLVYERWTDPVAGEILRDAPLRPRAPEITGAVVGPGSS